MSTDYYACTKQAGEMMNETSEKRNEWMRRILFLCATLFGILISLHSATQTNIYTRLCFAAACISLALGTLLLAIASYQYVAVLNRTRKKYLQEIQNAMSEQRAVRGVVADNISLFSICEIASYVFLLLSILLLAAYSLLLVVLQ